MSLVYELTKKRNAFLRPLGAGEIFSTASVTGRNTLGTSFLCAPKKVTAGKKTGAKRAAGRDLSKIVNRKIFLDARRKVWAAKAKLASQ